MLKEAGYALAMATLSEQIAKAVSRYPDHKVILSAFGTNNYLWGLRDDARRALRIGVANMRALNIRLWELNKPSGYTDRAPASPFWQEVNQGLATAIGYEGRW